MLASGHSYSEVKEYYLSTLFVLFGDVVRQFAPLQDTQRFSGGPEQLAAMSQDW